MRYSFLGHLLGPGDEWAAQGEWPAVLSNEFWHTRFQASPGALGSVLRLNGQAFVVVGVLSLLAAVIACVGLYGLLSYTLVQRRREIGLRMALGARPADIGRATLLRVLAILFTGALLGIAAAVPAARLMAAALPAWRASRTDPWQTLRGD